MIPRSLVQCSIKFVCFFLNLILFPHSFFPLPSHFYPLPPYFNHFIFPVTRNYRLLPNYFDTKVPVQWMRRRHLTTVRYLLSICLFDISSWMLHREKKRKERARAVLLTSPTVCSQQTTPSVGRDNKDIWLQFEIC